MDRAKGENGVVETHVEELLSGYLDGELTQQQRQRVELHVEACEACTGILGDIGALRRRLGETRLSKTGEDRWREMMDDTTVRASRGIGWLLLIGGLLLISGIVVYAFIADSSTGLFTKWVIAAIYIGLGALFVSVLRQRLIERKSDRYKDVEI